MLADYLPILVMVALAVGLASALVAAATYIGPRHPNPRKMSSYECGIEPVGSARMRFPVKFYLIAMLFIVFDVEAAFIYPWAVSLRELQVVGLTGMFSFIFILLVGYVYAWKKGAFKWK
ncbi:MAG: NADH-quinone oxidoreductase subunit A [Chloroflexi bacterium]|nr:NADH-quinone oxidoreductase subunit A [Chloroflexota bacterium]